MKKLPIYTSIPPAMVRFDPSGEEIGEAYQADCISSWAKSGFDPATINSAEEYLETGGAMDTLRRIVLTRDARDKTGRPLLYLRDFLNAIAEDRPGPVAIVNADIYLDIPEEFQKRLAELKPGEASFLHRVDTRRPGSHAGSLYRDGLDFFAFHTEDLKSIDTGEMVLGMPWWDHLLPILLLANGVERVVPERSDIVFHYKHDERWDGEAWIAYGNMFRSMILDLSERPHSDRAADYFNAFDDLVTGSNKPFLARMKTQWGGLRRRRRKARRARQLTQIAGANVSFIGTTG